MDVPSTSQTYPDAQQQEEAVSLYANVAPFENALEIYEEVADPHPELLGLVDAQIEFCDQLLATIAQKRKLLAEKKAWLEKKLDHERGLDSFARSKVPVIQYLPPYFKDENMMCPPQNEEAKHKLQFTTFDPLIKEDKKWTPSELRLLKESVKNSVILASVQKFKDRKEILREKIQRAGVETSPEEIKQWKDEIEDLDRKVKHAKEGQVDSAQVDVVDYSTVDWLKISTVEFKGTRSAAALRYKWLNEQCPRWNSGPWTKEELGKLKELREVPSFTSWAALAKKLQTQRTPYQCFERYRSDMYRMTRDWTKEEDDRLIALVKVMTVNGTVQWDKVTFYMPGRHRQQCRTRYQRTLDENVRHGRWSDHEDLLLMSAVARFGAKDWAKVAKAVVGRSDGQCRERWCNVLDKCTLSGDWTPEEDERLILGVQLFGRGQWSKFTDILPRHTPESMMDRYQALLSAKMRLCSARLIGFPAEYRSAMQTSVHKAKRDVLRQQLLDDTLKAQCYRAAKEQAQRTTSRTNSRKKPANAGLTNEERELLDKGIDEISKKYRDNNSTPDMKEIFAKIKLNDKEISNIVCAAKQRRLCESVSRRESPRTFRRPLTKAPVRKIKKTSMLKVDSIYERTEFEPHETEEERVMCMTEALCHAIRKYDHYEWCNRFHEDHLRPEDVASTFVFNLLNNRCAHVASRLRECEYFPPDLTLAPTFSSAAAYRVFESSRVSLTKRASQYFNPSNCISMGMLLYPEGDVVRTFKTYDRLHIQLHPNILTNENYLKLKTQVRAVLLEPTMLAMAIEPPEAVEQRNKTQMELMELMMAQQDEIFTESAMGDVANEVVVDTCEEGEPIHYDDAYDDALNATIHTVISKARHVEPRPRRGRMTNAERWVAQYRALQKEMDLPVNRKIQPDRSAKNKTYVEAGVDGISDEYVELDAAEDMRPATSNSNQAVEVVPHGDSARSVNDVDGAKLRLQREFVDQVVEEADRMSEILEKCPKKRKRIKPKRSELSESTIRVENSASSVGLNQAEPSAYSTSVAVDGGEASEAVAQVGPSRLGGESKVTTVSGTGAASEELQGSTISNSNQEVVCQPAKKRRPSAKKPEVTPQENPVPSTASSQASSISDLAVSEAASAAHPTVTGGDGTKNAAGVTGATAEGLGAEAVREEVVSEPVKRRGRPRKSEVAPKEKQVPPVARSQSATMSDGGSAQMIHEEASAISSPIGGSAISTVAEDGGSSKAASATGGSAAGVEARVVQEVVSQPAKRRGRPRKSEVAPKEKVVPSVARSQSDSSDASSELVIDEYAPVASSAVGSSATSTVRGGSAASKVASGTGRGAEGVGAAAVQNAMVSEAGGINESPKRKRGRPVKWVSPSPDEQQADEKPTLGKRGRMEE